MNSHHQQFMYVPLLSSNHKLTIKQYWTKRPCTWNKRTPNNWMNKIIYIKLEWLIVFFNKVLLFNELIVFLVILTISLQVTSHLARASFGQILIMKVKLSKFSILSSDHWKFVITWITLKFCSISICEPMMPST